MPSKPLLYLIDGSSQMYRAYHAPIRTAEGTLLRNAMGIPTNAVYIFVTMLRKLMKEQHPEFIAASFDLPGRTFRDDLASDYKANRKPMPDELAGQIPDLGPVDRVPQLADDDVGIGDEVAALRDGASAVGADRAGREGASPRPQPVRSKATTPLISHPPAHSSAPPSPFPAG